MSYHTHLENLHPDYIHAVAGALAKDVDRARAQWKTKRQRAQQLSEQLGIEVTHS